MSLPCIGSAWLHRALSAVIVCFLLFGDRVGPTTDSIPYDLDDMWNSPNGWFRVEIETAGFSRNPQVSWRLSVVDNRTDTEVWAHQDESHRLAAGEFAPEVAYASNDGKIAIVCAPFVGSPDSRYGVTFYFESGQLETLHYSYLCTHPRMVYPLETRPAILGMRPARKWIDSIEFDGTSLAIHTTGLYSHRFAFGPELLTHNFTYLVKDDANPFLGEVSLNWTTVARLGLLCVALGFVALTVLLDIRRLYHRVLTWRGQRRLRRGHCPRCGYLLFGLTEPRCPECGCSTNGP